MLVVYASSSWHAPSRHPCLGPYFFNMQFSRHAYAALLHPLPQDSPSACVWYVPGTWEELEP